MIRISKELPNDATQRSTTCHHPINAYKMSAKTALKSHNSAQMAGTPTAMPLFNNNNNGCIGGGFGRKTKTNVAAAAASVMSSLAADLCKVAKTTINSTTTTTTMPTTPAVDAAVVVNSIIYSKPSFCSIVVDIGGKETTTPPTPNITPNLGNFISPQKHLANDQSNDSIPKANEGKPALITIPPHPDDVPHVYMMSTILNGSIHHHISEICDNLIAMGLFGMVENNNSEHDDDSLTEFSYNDNDDDEDDIEFLHTDEDLKRQEDEYDDDEDDDDEDLDEDEDSDCDSDEDKADDYVNNNIEDYETDEDQVDGCQYKCDGGQDVTDFCKGPLFVTKTPALMFHSEKKKKVRFNAKPTVHVMRTWDYAYRAARKGEWEMYARDRERFKLRIQRTALTLDPILNREHRQKVYEQRFSELFTKEKEKLKAEDENKKNNPEESSLKTSPPKTETEKAKNNNNQNQNKNKHRKKKKRKRRRPNF